MPGIDPTVLGMINHEQTLAHIRYDIRSDFILSPHYSSVYANVGQDLWNDVSQELRSGQFEPSIPGVMEIPKKNGLSRPASILSPKDRFIYQALVDVIAPIAEQQVDRSRVFSNVLLDSDQNSAMFQAGSICWNNLQSAIRTYCEDDSFSHAVKTDIANYFERLYQHNLINLLHTCGCPSGAINLLEELLLAWMERDSHGILQGLFPSDFLGNFYLVGMDSDFAVRNVPSARYVDDIYAFYPSIESARIGLIELTRTLRHEGLHLNESKTGIFETSSLLFEETELDRRFQVAREELEAEQYEYSPYGFELIWSVEEEDTDEGERELQAVEALYSQVNEVEEGISEKIDKFCLPIFASSGYDIAVERALEGMVLRPHLSGLYSTYLSAVARMNSSIFTEIEQTFQNSQLPYDWQLMWFIALLIRADTLQVSTVNSAFRILRDMSRSEALRGLCSILISKHGNAGHRRNVRNQYADDTSSYVRSAILFSTRYFPTPERRTCLGAWGGHSDTNSLIARAVQAIIR